MERMPQATHNKIVLEANKDIVGEFLLREDIDTHCLLSLDKLEPVFENCRELNSPNLCSKVTSLSTCGGLVLCMTLQSFEALATGPTSNVINFQAKVTRNKRCLCSRCQRLVQEVE